MERDLTVNERACLAALLAVPFDGAEAFRQQARDARAIVGSTFVAELVIPLDAPRSSNPSRRPVEAEVRATEEGAWGGIIVWADDGRLSALEYHWTDDEKPRDFPSAARLYKIQAGRS